MNILFLSCAPDCAHPYSCSAAAKNSAALYCCRLQGPPWCLDAAGIGCDFLFALFIFRHEQIAFRQKVIKKFQKLRKFSSAIEPDVENQPGRAPPEQTSGRVYRAVGRGGAEIIYLDIAYTLFEHGVFHCLLDNTSALNVQNLGLPRPAQDLQLYKLPSGPGYGFRFIKADIAKIQSIRFTDHVRYYTGLRGRQSSVTFSTRM